MKRVTIAVDSEVDIKFRKKASQLYQFEKGWYSKAVVEAMDSWADETNESPTNIDALMNSINPKIWENLKLKLKLDETDPFENMENIINYFEQDNEYSLEIDRDTGNNLVIGFDKNEKNVRENLDTLMLLHLIVNIIITSMEESTHDKYEISGVEKIPKIYLRKVPK